jgi:hypothetical protein
MKTTRRNHLAALGSALVAASGVSANAQEGRADSDGDVLYGHGLVWNRDLPGVAGELQLAFDMRVNLETGLGSGTAHDPVHAEENVHFAIHSAERTRLRGGESQFMLKGVVTKANNPASVGLPVRMLAQTRGDTTAIAIAIGDHTFAGAGLVVIAIIGVLIALLVPAVQKV